MLGSWQSVKCKTVCLHTNNNKYYYYCYYNDASWGSRDDTAELVKPTYAALTTLEQGLESSLLGLPSR